jgi:hypothetical protein
VTLFGIFLTPVFYYVIQWFNDLRMKQPAVLLEPRVDQLSAGAQNRVSRTPAEAD